MNREQVAHTLETTPKMLRTLLTGVDEALHTWRPEADEWSINEIIGHLIDSDSHAFFDRIQLMLDKDEPMLPGVDVNALSAQRTDNEQEAFSLLNDLAEQRTGHASFVRTLSNEQMARTGSYKSYGLFRVSDFVYEWAYHDFDHTQQIMENLKTAAWPRFSDTMKTALSR